MRDPSLAMSTSLVDLSACFHATQSAVMQMSADIRAGAFAQSSSSQERIGRMAEINNLRATLQHLSQSLEFTARALGHLSVEEAVNHAPDDIGASASAGGLGWRNPSAAAADALPVPTGSTAVAASTGVSVSSSNRASGTTTGGTTAGGGGGRVEALPTPGSSSSSTSSSSTSVQPATAAAPRSSIMQPGFLNRANNASATTSGANNNNIIIILIIIILHAARI